MMKFQEPCFAIIPIVLSKLRICYRENSIYSFNYHQSNRDIYLDLHEKNEKRTSLVCELILNFS